MAEACSIAECKRPHFALGLCNAHYSRQRRGQSLDAPIINRVGESMADRLWRQVDRRGPDQCWPWTGNSAYKDGRGRIRVMREGKRRGESPAPRLAWELENGRQPEGHILHRCHYPPCCNPAHLYEGDPMLNVQDAIIRGTAKAGAQKRLARRPHGPRAKLTEEQVEQIRSLYAAGHKQVDLAEQFGTPQSNVSRIVRGCAWNLDGKYPILPRRHRAA